VLIPFIKNRSIFVDIVYETVEFLNAFQQLTLKIMQRDGFSHFV